MGMTDEAEFTAQLIECVIGYRADRPQCRRSVPSTAGIALALTGGSTGRAIAMILIQF
jgi:hypothetical protein